MISFHHQFTRQSFHELTEENTGHPELLERPIYSSGDGTDHEEDDNLIDALQ
jgi:hypothetical protein